MILEISLTDVMRTQLNSGNAQVNASRTFTNTSTLNPNHSISHHFFQTKTLGILARNLNVITSSVIGK